MVSSNQRLLYQIVIVVAAAVVTAAIAVVITVIVIRNNEDTPATVTDKPRTTVTDIQRTTVTDIPRTTTSSGEINYQTVLREYCETPDPTYSYHTLSEHTVIDPVTNTTTIVLNMTSQAWSTPELVGNGHIWWHYMSVTIPHELRYQDTALIYITGGSNIDSPPTPNTESDVQLAVQISSRLGMVVATLFQVPNQPIRFPNDKRDFDRYEDNIIAFCWRRFITEAPEDPYFLLRMPMTKATVRAMDTVSNVVSSKIKRFYLTGLSKRGWTAWSTAAVDDRVVGIAPVVLDILNFKPNLQHHFRSLKGWTFALEPYWSENNTLLWDHPNFDLLIQVSDPFSYRDILTMPKYIITAANDEFFLPDDSHYFYDEMKGPTHLRIHPNVGHDLTPRVTFFTSELVAFIASVEADWEFPSIVWTRNENDTHGEIRMVIEGQTPKSVKAYRADTMNDFDRRDFRLHYWDGGPYPVRSMVTYEEFEVYETTNEYIAVTEMPADGAWTCFFIEAEFEAVGGLPIRFTSEVNIIPDVFPIEECTGLDCYGTIV